MYTINDVYYFAENAHDGQTRRDGHSYFYQHVCRVRDAAYKIACELGDFSLDCHKLQVLAFLHDVVEDCKSPNGDEYIKDEEEFYYQLRQAGIEEGDVQTAKLVPKYLTRKPGQSYGDYVRCIIACDDHIVKIVKYADMLTNMKDCMEDIEKGKNVEAATKSIRKYADHIGALRNAVYNHTPRASV